MTKSEIDLEGAVPTAYLELRKVESAASSVMSAGRSRGEEEERVVAASPSPSPSFRDVTIQPHMSVEMERMLNQLELNVKQAQLDSEEAKGMIEELRTSRRELSKSKMSVEDKIIRKQMKAKKEALKLHLEYLEHSLRLHRKLKNNLLPNSGREEAEMIQFCRLICGILSGSHVKIQEVMNMPLEHSREYCKKIKLRMGGAMKFAQNNPKATGAGTFGVGLLAAAGLTFVLGPFGAVLALAVTASTYGYLSTQSSHEYSNAFRSIDKCASRLNPKGTRKRLDRNKLQLRLTQVAARETTSVPGIHGNERNDSKSQSPFGGSFEIDCR